MIKFLLLFLTLITYTHCLTGFVTYHLYNAATPLSTCACSDGANGLMTRWKYQNLQSMFPFVTSFSQASWNSPNCGKCIKLINGSKVVYVTVIDSCGPPSSQYNAHFDVSMDAFMLLYGSTAQGTGSITWSFVQASFCRGNRG